MHTSRQGVSARSRSPRGWTFLIAAACCIVAASAHAQKVVTLRSFSSFNSNGDNLDGGSPEAPMVLGPDGDLYGTTSAGGQFGDGTIFKISPAGKGTILHYFQDTDHSFYQYSGLTLGPDGNFYGTTLYGGANGNGSIYQITPAGTYTTIYSFTQTSNGTNSDGTGPWAGLLYDSATGLFYGTTGGGGQYGYGTVYSVSTGGAENTLYSFQNADTQNSPEGDGNTPQAVLAIGPDGALYGTTLGGGGFDDGTAFRVTTGGSFSTIHVFADTDNNDASEPNGLTLGPDGNLYGTAQSGGQFNWGCVFRMSSAGAVVLINSFTNGNDGGAPFGNVIFGPHGVLFGTTSQEGFGSNSAGTLFALAPDGSSRATLFSFGGPDLNLGAYPTATLTYDPNAKNGFTLFGTTKSGSNGNGNVFALSLNVVAREYFAADAGTFVSLLNGGIVTFTLSANGTFTGKMILNGVSHSIRGSLDYLGGFDSEAGAAIPLSMDLNSSVTLGDINLSGQIDGQNFTAYHAAYAKGATATEEGATLLTLTPAAAGPGIPATAGPGKLAVAKAGSARLSGKLPDGAAYTASDIIVGGPDGDQCLIYASVAYKNPATRGAKGTLTGAITFPGGAITGPLQWLKPAQTKGAFPAAINTGLTLSP